MRRFFALTLFVIGILLRVETVHAQRGLPVAQAPNVSATSNPNPSNLNDSVTLTATVADPQNATTPTGTVTFTDTFNGNTTVLSSVSLTPTQGAKASTALYTTTSLAAGSHSILASYNGDTSFTAASSAPITQTVKQASSVVISFTSSPNPSTLNQAVVLNATLSTTNPNGLTGNVTFMDGDTTLATIGVGANGASYTTSALTIGVHSLTAMYSGDTNNSTAAGSTTQTVNKANSSVTLTSSANPSSSGNVTFTATVKPVAPGTGVATGNVVFSDGANELGSVAVDSTGTATFAATNLSSGSHSITASYAGDNRNAASTASITQSISSGSAGVATVTLSATPNPAEQGAAVTITAHVVVPTGTPTGAVTVSANNNQLGMATLDASGDASFTTTALPVGATEIEVSFDGAGFYPSGSGTIMVTVNQHQLGGGTPDGGTTTTSSSSSSGSTTTSSGSAADGGTTTTTPTNNVVVGSTDNSGCSASSSNPLSGIAAFALGMLGLALVRRRRAA